ncbi:MAG: hypothetical protein CR991_05305 [Proteobacteria bacterium]|nr:MAG: hypothetical protein CR991_05305 [Pseudomonadota bacterium]
MYFSFMGADKLVVLGKRIAEYGGFSEKKYFQSSLPLLQLQYHLLEFDDHIQLINLFFKHRSV